MYYTEIKALGKKMSRISIGGWQSFGDLISDEDVCNEILKFSIENGINHIDLANNYGLGKSEIIVGKFINEYNLREDIILSTKFGRALPPETSIDLSYENAVRSLKNSLLRLNVDFIDIYYCHRYDAKTPLYSIVETMTKLIDSGAIKAWGTSKWSPEIIRKAIAFADSNGLSRPIVEQTEYSLVKNEHVLEITDLGVELIGRSPLAMGLLSGKYLNGIPINSRLAKRSKLYDDYFTHRNNQIATEVSQIAWDIGCTPAQLSIAWCLRNKKILSLIIGGTSLAQISENILALNMNISDTIFSDIDSVINGK